MSAQKEFTSAPELFLVVTQVRAVMEQRISTTHKESSAVPRRTAPSAGDRIRLAMPG